MLVSAYLCVCTLASFSLLLKGAESLSVADAVAALNDPMVAAGLLDCPSLCQEQGFVKHVTGLSAEDCGGICSMAKIELAQSHANCEKAMADMVKDPVSGGKAMFASARVEDALAALYGVYKDYMRTDGDVAAMLWDGGLVSDFGQPDYCNDLEGYTHCRLTSNFVPRPMGPLWGLCLPDACIDGDALHQLSELMFGLLHQPGLGGGKDLFEMHCGIETVPLGAGTWITMTVILLLAALGSVDSIRSRYWSNSAGASSASGGYRQLKDEEQMAALKEGLGGSGDLEGRCSTRKVAVAVPYDSAAHSGRVVSRMDSRDDSSMYKSTWGKIVKAYSVEKNWPQLFSLDFPGNGEYKCIEGMRVCSMTWVVLGHSGVAMLLVDPGVENMADVIGHNGEGWSASWWHQPLTNCFMSVDTFLTIGGILAAVMLLQKASTFLSPKKIPQMYLLRWLRLTPVMYMGMACQLYLTPIFGYGPYFNLDDVKEACSQYWWVYAFYIQNIYPGAQASFECIGEAWYLALDMQLFLFLPWMVMLHLRSRKASWALMMSLIVSSMLFSFVLAYKYDFHYAVFNMFLDFQNGSAKTYKANYYNGTFTRMPSYVIGVMTGFLWHDVLRGVRFTRKGVTTLTLLAFVLLWVPLYCQQPSYNDFGHDIATIWRALYVMCSKVMWSTGISILCILCFAKQGHIIQRTMGFRVWVPLGKLSFSVFFLHAIPIIVVLRNRVFASRFDNPSYLTIYCFAMIVSYVAAIPMYLLVELPVKNMIGAFLLKGGKGKSKSKESKEHAGANEAAPATEPPVHARAIEAK